MIETLRLLEIAIVDEAELDFGKGLNVLTGETGAGKSIVLGALGLLVGGRGSADLLRAGADEGAAEAIFGTADQVDLERNLGERGLEASGEDAHQLVVRRSISRHGRSRARVSGQLVPLSVLGELFSGRVEISSQHSSQTLLRAESHGRALDAAGGLLDLRASVHGHYEAVRGLDRELAALRHDAEERARQQDFLRFQIAEIDEVGLQEGEIANLEGEHARLAHADRLRGEGGTALAALVGDPVAADQGGSADRLDKVLQILEGLEKLDPDLTSLSGRLRANAAELRECASDLEAYLDRVEADPSRLSRLEQRLGEVERLRRKYGDTQEEIHSRREHLALELASADDADESVVGLEREREAHASDLARDAAELSARRAHAAQQLARTLKKSLRELGMPEASFEVSLEKSASATHEGLASGPTGAEVPEFRFSANPGEPLRALQKVASGGELSRLFLALKTALRRDVPGMVLVFDEVDAGIGGRLAEKVGRMLASLARDHQVLCITHLPQIAAFADVHFRVRKRGRGGRARVAIDCIEGEERVEEIARMAGGEEISAATRRHARELLGAKRGG